MWTQRNYVIAYFKGLLEETWMGCTSTKQAEMILMKPILIILYKVISMGFIITTYTLSSLSLPNRHGWA